MPFISSRILVFSDFNCPYCFTLNEWLSELGVSDRIRWVGIEHRPDLPRQGGNAPQDRAILQQEVEDVSRRAPEVGVVMPQTWTNSHEALLIQNAVEDDDPERAPLLRRTLFQLYWRQSVSLVDVASLHGVLDDLTIDRPETEPEYLTTMTQWWRDRLDRIPVMIAPTGIAHLGLQTREQVRTFLNSALRQPQSGPGCR